MKNGILFALKAVVTTWPDDRGCSSGSTADYIVDGVLGFDSSDNTTVDWSESEVYSGPDCSATCAASGYWSGKLAGWEFGHTNSLWVDTDKQWTLSLFQLDRIIMVDGDPASGTYRDLVWEMGTDQNQG